MTSIPRADEKLNALTEDIIRALGRHGVPCQGRVHADAHVSVTALGNVLSYLLAAEEPATINLVCANVARQAADMRRRGVGPGRLQEAAGGTA